MDMHIVGETYNMSDPYSTRTKATTKRTKLHSAARADVRSHGESSCPVDGKREGPKYLDNMKTGLKTV
jgi:hypothetical protein